MRKLYISTFLTCLVVTMFFTWRSHIWDSSEDVKHLKIGFICESDESGPYTYNFTLAQTILEETYGNRIQVLVRRNILDSEVKDPVMDLVNRDCRILFYNGHSTLFCKLAAKYPEVDFCQVTCFDPSGMDLPANYHTFHGMAWQGRYVSGIAAGCKIQNMLDNHYLDRNNVLVGFIAPFESPDVISSYTAFLLGIRSVVPEARMKVLYTGSWNSYSAEKECAKRLIEEGCVVLSHHTDTAAAAIVCEEAVSASNVFFVGFNDTMIDVAPTTALISARINWVPYITQAVEAVLEEREIEKTVSGIIHGNDVCGGFEDGWIEMVDLNPLIAVSGTQKKMEEAVDALNRKTELVFQGDYIGTDPKNPEDTIDLKKGYHENEHSSMASFHYILRDIIETDSYR